MLYCIPKTAKRNRKYIKILQKNSRSDVRFIIRYDSSAVILSGIYFSLIRVLTVFLKSVFRKFKSKHGGFTGSTPDRNGSAMLFQYVLYKR